MILLQQRVVCQMMSLLFRYEIIPIIVYLILKSVIFSVFSIFRQNANIQNQEEYNQGLKIIKVITNLIL